MNMLSPVSKKPKKIALSLGAAVVAIAVPALASTPIFHNQGYISGFDGGQVNKDADCQVMQSDPNNAATHYPVGDANSVYVNTNFTGTSHRYHAMVRKTNAYTQDGDEGYYSWSFRLKSTWDFSAQGYVIGQFIANYTGTNGCGEDWMPTTMIWLYGNGLRARVKNGQVCNQHTIPSDAMTTGNSGWHIPSTLGGGSDLAVTAGTWHTIQLGVKWTSGTTGYFKLWYDGNKVFEQYNIATTISDWQPYEFQVGLYSNKWYDDKVLVGSQGFRELWVDRIAINNITNLGGCTSAFQYANPSNSCW
jgi:hypothetical protein